MKQGAESPLVTTGLEQFRDAATWQAVITNLTSSAAAYEVHGYGGKCLCLNLLPAAEQISSQGLC